MSKASEKKQAQQYAISHLRKILPPGSTVYTINVHTSRSGMMRHLRCYTIKDGEPVYISGYVARACGWPLATGWHGDAVKVSGCGLDVGFHLTMTLSYALHGNDPKGNGALSENQGRPFEPRPGHFRAGYSLKHSWL